MKNLLFLLTTMLSGQFLTAQDNPDSWMVSEGTLEGFAVGTKYYTLVTDANLRNKPGTQSIVLAKLPIGTQVTIEEVANDSFEQRGVKLPWLKVSCQPVGSPVLSGYLWGGFMALASIQTPDEEYQPNRGVLFLTGVAAFDAEKHLLTVQVRAALAGKELSKAEFTTNGDLSYYPSFEVGFEALKDVKAVLSVNYYYPACGYPSGNSLLFWQNDNQLTKVLGTSSISEGGVFYDSEEWILPSQRGGIGDHVLVIKDSSQFEEKGEDLIRSSQTYKVALYKWSGKKLMKVKELK